MERQIIAIARILVDPWAETCRRMEGWDDATSHLFEPTADWAMDKAARLFAAGARIVQIDGGTVE